PLRVEHARRQTKKGVDVALVEQLAPNGLPRAALEEDVVRDDDGRLPLDLEQGLDVLHEVELLVGGRGPEVVPDDSEVLSAGLTVRAHHSDRRLASERRVG